ncbi:unnamed protein product [Periconia digitata]|uniref:DUF676 domain-containing protein n=1 Tax=Periconia digitata TaxID=1303443 RepID=A0A9W4XLT1_9PLEO|nr:unnamed protein product [Periconia digitata]
MTSTPPPPYSEYTGERDAPAPPPLPPRLRSNNAIPPPSVEPSLSAMSATDPRSSSSQSLVPESSERDGRRRLLLVYIHGFQGDETSFRSFPAHLHNMVTITLSDSHVVHTKIYPKYQSRYAIAQARDNFSNWLAPHEDQWTDVILLSHSMGGLIAADVALLFRHRIIGTIEFDVPFLGMHPGIVKAGLGSIFKPWPMPDETAYEQSQSNGSKPSRMNTLFNPKPSDPNFNPSFHNDVHLPVRKGWENTLHWFNKHSNGIREAGKNLVSTHLEFGGAMADFSSLKARYAKIRALEEDDEELRRSVNTGHPHPPRIRFVNYWTASLGRPKKSKSPKLPQSPSASTMDVPQSPPASQNDAAQSLPPSTENASPLDVKPVDTSTIVSTEDAAPLDSKPVDTSSLASTSQLSLSTDESSLRQISPRISVEQHVEGEVIPVTPQEPPSATVEHTADGNSRPELPEIPPIPQEPPFVDLTEFPDRAHRRAAEKEHDQALKMYHQAVKARNKVINERDKIEEKWEKQQRKQQQREASNLAKQQKEKQKQEDKEDREREKQEEKEDAEKRHENSQYETGLEADVGAVQLGDPRPSQSSNSPYGNFTFSRSTVMNQADPSEQRAMQSRPSYNDSIRSDSVYSLGTVSNADSHTNPAEPAKKRRIRKFCILPSKDANGNRDPTWIKVDMGEIDEVAAHTTLFFLSDRYEQLVGDVGARIEDWVREADGLRAAREMEGLF